MIRDYLWELDTISQRPRRSEEDIRKFYDEIVSSSCTELRKIYCNDSNKTIGFLIIGFHPNCHPHANYYIEEAYIKPQYRCMGYMTRAISDFIHRHTGIYCLFILNENIAAYRFWMNLFAKLGYCECFLIDVGAGDEYCTQYGFAPSSHNE